MISKEEHPKESMKDHLKELQESQYPRGNRKDVMNKMTSIPEADQIKFNECQSWKEIHKFHKESTPWLDDTQINEIIKLYKMEAQTRHHKGKLDEEKLWMLNDI